MNEFSHKVLSARSALVFVLSIAFILSANAAPSAANEELQALVKNKITLGDGAADGAEAKLVEWAESNKFPRLAEFINVLSEDDAAVIAKLFHDGTKVTSTEFAPVVAPVGSGETQTTVLAFPFEGEFFVAQGNCSWISHKKSTSNEYAYDFVIQKNGGMVFGNSAKNEKYYAWGRPVLSPAPGVVINTRDGNEDHPPLTTALNKSNFVKILHENGEVSNIHHIMNGSITVKEGQKVERGEAVGKIGDSGISMFPHIHYQLDRVDGEKTTYAPSVFACYFARHKDSPAWRLVINGRPQEGEYVASPDEYLNIYGGTSE